MITIDGSQGEGGGQILRSALGLSLVTGKPFAIHRIRANRTKPGLMRQHLTAVHAACAIGDADVTGASLGSRELTFKPRTIRTREHHFAVGTAGSATLVLQTVLPAMLCGTASATTPAPATTPATDPCVLRLEGGTHNPWAPPYDFLNRTFLPLVGRLGPAIEATLVRPGFYPAGGGEFRVAITPARALAAFDLLDRGAVRRVRATATVAHLPRSIAERELKVVSAKLGLAGDDLCIAEAGDSRGPGNVVTIEVQCEHLTEVFTGFGQRGVPAEAVAADAVEQTRHYLAKGAAAGEYLTDQLLIPFAMAGGGAFRTLGLSRHAQTNIEVIQSFLDVRFDITRDEDAGCIVRICT